MKKNPLLVLIILLAFSVTLFAGGAAQRDGAAGVRMTSVGTPRTETLVVDILNGFAADPFNINPYLPGAAPMDAGFHQLLFHHLWEINTVTGEQFPELAAEMPRPMNANFTRFQFRTREGIRWTDGVPFSAEDVEFTINMILRTRELGFHGYLASIVRSVRAIDRNTIEIETHQPEPKLSQKLGVVIWGQALRIMPKHIWERENPATFRNPNPIGVGAYTLIQRDTIQGSWWLYERRPDWQYSVTGQLVGQPGPRYVLFQFFGNEERRVMAAINNELDILQDISPESMEILLQRSNHIRAWHAGFPFANFDDPCQRGMLFNTAVPPYDNPDVRWALALATDIVSVSMATFGGMLRVSPIQVPPIAVLQNTYHKPMVPWLRSFTLSDGYRPFDETYARVITETLRREGRQGLPRTPQEEIDMFGIGWWRYDVEQAARMLERHGFRRGTGGRWNLPNGQPWRLTILAPADFEVQSMRLAFAVADSWRRFGLEVEVRQMDSASFWGAESTGNYEIGSYWPSCGLIPDTTAHMRQWHQQYIVPIGQEAPGNRARWANARVSQLLDELSALPSDHRDIVPKITEINQEFVRHLPFLPMVGTSKFVPVNTYFWEGFQTADNHFEGPWWWWSQVKHYLPHFRPTGRR